MVTLTDVDLWGTPFFPIYFSYLVPSQQYQISNRAPWEIKTTVVKISILHLVVGRLHCFVFLFHLILGFGIVCTYVRISKGH